MGTIIILVAIGVACIVLLIDEWLNGGNDE